MFESPITNRLLQFLLSNKKTPNIQLDFELKNNQLFLILINNSTESARNVKVTSNHTLLGINGTTNLLKHSLFQNITEFSSFKQFSIFIDHTNVFFQNQEQLLIEFQIEFENKKGQKFQEVILHNLSIYKDLPNHSYSKST